jgi:uncharacterized sulfatase
MKSSLSRRGFVRLAGVGAAGLFLSSCASELSAGKSKSNPPNVMIVIGDDMTWHDCEPYGSGQVRTPNMKALADEGMRFDRMFTTTAMCAPTRQQLYTGMYPVRSGAYPNHSRVYDGVKSVAHYLKDLGYRVGLIGKTHIKPPASYPFEYLKGNASSVDSIAEFVNRDKSQPYLLMVASNEPHGPWSKGDPAAYPQEKIDVPPYFVDNETTREAMAKYLAEITFLDGQLGDCMKIIDESGSKENTIAIFTSEQGASFPAGGKWTCYDTGLKTAFIVRWPGRVKAGSSTKAMTQYIDVVPTLIEAAGGDPKAIKTGRADAKGYKGFDGMSFLSVLEGASDKLRDYVFGAHTTRGIINGSECYPIRSVRSSRYKYIANLNHEVVFTNALTKGGANSILGSWKETGKSSKAAAERAKAYQYRSAEELYDMENDPWEMNNLAADVKYAKVRNKLKSVLRQWMVQQGDKGNATELLAKERQGRGNAKPQNNRKKNAATRKKKGAGS